VSSRILLFVRDIALAGVLGPNMYGIWIQMTVVFNYALHLPLGFQHVMSREVPYYLGRQENERAIAIQDIVFAVMLSTSLLASIVVIVLLEFSDYHPLALSLPALLVVLAVVIVQQINSFYSILLRARQQFIAYSVGFVLVALISLVFGVLFAQLWGAVGVAIAQGLALFAVTVFWLLRTPYHPSLKRLHWAEFNHLTRIAIPLFFVGICGLLIVSIDRLMMVFFYSEEQIGFYGLAYMVNQSVSLIVMPVVQSITPRMMLAYGRHNDTKKIQDYLFLLTQGVGSCVAVFVGTLYFWAGDIVMWLLPDFSPAIPAIQALLMGGAFLAMANGGNTFLVAVNRQSQVLSIQVVMIVVQVIIIGALGNAGSSIAWIAQAMAVTFIGYSVLCLFIAGITVEESTWKGLLFSLRSCLPICYLLLCSVLIANWYPSIVVNTPQLINVLRTFVYGIAVIPVALFFVRRVVRR
jgi:O-antigen/teichoic acid export membrane protein